MESARCSSARQGPVCSTCTIPTRSRQRAFVRDCRDYLAITVRTALGGRSRRLGATGMHDRGPWACIAHKWHSCSNDSASYRGSRGCSRKQDVIAAA